MNYHDAVPDLENLDRQYREEATAAGGLTEDELALEFTRRHAVELRYVAPWGKWLRWNGYCWEVDSTLKTLDLARAVCRDAGANIDNSKLRARTMSAATRAAVENLARSDPAHAATTDQWDCDPLAINTPRT